MGKVIVRNVILKNHKDEHKAEDGIISQDQVRQITLDMIADTGALAVGLPKSMIEKLGLPFLKKASSKLADGTSREVEVFEDLRVVIDDRVAITQCIAKPEDAPYLLGQLVFEQMDYVVDCRNQKLIPNPDAPDGMMLYEDF
ncbi:MAG: hypothetical protein HQM12_19390 [SAR324 cluster bacterium]|nr:hypothetical protein [SAR324 cluster bacterium]MBF0351715.1 hypothetical protein [SAR324 cluster bacterium]